MNVKGILSSVKHFFFQRNRMLTTALFCIGALAMTDTSAQFHPVRERMMTESLNGSWKIKMFEGQDVPAELSDWTKTDFNVAAWNDVLVPGNWETQGLKHPEYGKDLGAYTGLYRRMFSYNTAWDGRHVMLRFDGVLFSYEVFVKGYKIGGWGSAFNLFQFDITPYLIKNKENILCVKVSTRSLPTQQPNAWQFDTNDCWSLSGITRDVEIFTLDNVYLQDVKFVSDVLENNDAKIAVDVNIEEFKNTGGQGINEGYKMQVSLSDPQNNHVLDFRENIAEGKKIFHFNSLLEKPHLWTAETPVLYRLEVCILNSQDVVVQRFNEYVGIRSVKIDGFELKVNNVPVLLRGVCLNEIDPKLGRAMTYKERRRQLEMMKAANINFIRTAHYPFGPDFYDLCDQMGFYVCDEVPFGYGDENLGRKEYIPELISRAEATVRRDKNRPSVIIWSIGNENPYTSVVEEVVKYVKEKDPTRPRGLPQRGSDYRKLQGKQSPNVDIYMAHYVDVNPLNESLQTTDKPLILTEYAHSLGLAMDELENQFANILAQPRIIGGSVWCWTDQAVLTDGKTKIEGTEKQLGDNVDNSIPQSSKVEQGVFIAGNYYMDNFGNNGADGIVYANGYPQEDFYLVRKIYSPVQVLTDNLPVNFGKENIFEIELVNRFDFISLNGYKINWKLRSLHKTIAGGTVWLDIPAKNKGKIFMKANVPQLPDLNDWMLCLEVIDPGGKAINEKNIVLQKGQFLDLINAIPGNKNLAVTVSKNGILHVKEDGKTLLESPLLMRVGRKLTITSENQTLKDRFNWNPYILQPVVDEMRKQATKEGTLFTLSCHWGNAEAKSENRGLEGIVDVLVRKNNMIKIDYRIKPYKRATGNLLECGLTLEMSTSFDTFRWLGDGVFSSTTGKTAFNERNIWALHRNDIRFNGNRANIDVAVVTTGKAAGIGLWSSNGNIGVENTGGKILVSQNEIVAGYGSKFKAPQGRLPLNELDEISGTLVMFFNTSAQWPEFIEKLFMPRAIVNPENPYLESYGW
ncbi:MAG: glycoside hydrolase family 2 TIM barrel-domain containing protein [Niabella sp.]